jgi:hypothetical protein
MVPISHVPLISIPVPVHLSVGGGGNAFQSFPAFLLLGAGQQGQPIGSRLGSNIDQSPAPVRYEPGVSAFAGLVPWAKQPHNAIANPHRRKPMNKRPTGQRPEPLQQSESCHA